MCATQTIGRIEIHTRRIADDLDGELWCNRMPFDGPRRPRESDAEQPAIEQQRVGTLERLRQARVVRAVDGRKQWIATVGGAPTIANRLNRDAHRIGRLVTRHTGAAVAANGREERMAAGFE